mmetsp:Transcript_20373/g.70582  ORF Transcript_20373/g.70582 Transcript_20373/m.70582 type:complete len:217 (-) Transcript_20373:3594-4244(-)
MDLLRCVAAHSLQPLLHVLLHDAHHVRLHGLLRLVSNDQSRLMVLLLVLDTLGNIAHGDMELDQRICQLPSFPLVSEHHLAAFRQHPAQRHVAELVDAALQLGVALLGTHHRVLSELLLHSDVDRIGTRVRPEQHLRNAHARAEFPQLAGALAQPGRLESEEHRGVALAGHELLPQHAQLGPEPVRLETRGLDPVPQLVELPLARGHRLGHGAQRL